jgi:hypothetical protein
MKISRGAGRRDGDEFVVGDPKVLFKTTRSSLRRLRRQTVHRRGKSEPRCAPIDIVLNWFAEVRRKVDEAKGQ